MKSIYTDLLLMSLTVSYIVDVSGFTQSWRSALARWLGRSASALRPLPPFDCGKCMTFWSCTVLALIEGALSLPVLAYICLLSCLSVTAGQVFIFIREGLSRLLDIMIDLTQKR